MLESGTAGARGRSSAPRGESLSPTHAARAAKQRDETSRCVFFCLFFRKAGLSKTRAVGFGRQRAHGGRLPVPTLRLSSLTCHHSASRLSDCNKENALRNCVPARGSLRAEEQQQQQQRPGSEGSTKSSPWKADGQRHAFDYVELSPLQQDPPSQGSPPRTRGSLRGSERAPKHHEDLERDLALRSEERRRWFESPDSGVPNADGLGGDSSRKAGEPDLPPSPLSEEQRARLNEEIEKKWLELERLPLKDSRRVPLTALLNQGKGNQGGDLNEALRKEVRASVLSESWLLTVHALGLCASLAAGDSAEERGHPRRWHGLHGAAFWCSSAFGFCCLLFELHL